MPEYRFQSEPQTSGHAAQTLMTDNALSQTALESKFQPIHRVLKDLSISLNELEQRLNSVMTPPLGTAEAVAQHLDCRCDLDFQCKEVVEVGSKLLMHLSSIHERLCL